MFNHTHYVPILRWKGAEKEALKQLGDSDKKRMTPLVELPRPSKPPQSSKSAKKPRKLKTVYDLMGALPEEISESWGGSPIFLDLHLIDKEASLSGIEKIYADSHDLNLNLIPVLNLNYDKPFRIKVAEIAKHDNRGICVRLSPQDLAKLTLNAELEELRKLINLDLEKIDLVIDLKITDMQTKFLNVMEKIPSVNRWRTFTIASGAFPEFLSKLDIGPNDVARFDWQLWRQEILTDGLLRKPTYSDYTIQYPHFKELNFIPKVSKSIRYTVAENWLVMRGQADNAKGSMGSKQWPAHAQLLSKRADFCGEDFSSGDKYIKEKGLDLETKYTGSATTWLTAGINHHMVYVLNQISNLFSNVASV